MHRGAVDIEKLQARAQARSDRFGDDEAVVPMAHEEPQIDIVIEHKSDFALDGDVVESAVLFVHAVLVAG